MGAQLYKIYGQESCIKQVFQGRAI